MQDVAREAIREYIERHSRGWLCSTRSWMPSCRVMPRRSSAWAVEASSLLYLTLEELLHVAERVLPEVLVRDIGLLHSALERPRAAAFGRDAYPTLELKAAALTTRSCATMPWSTGTSGWGWRLCSPSSASTGADSTRRTTRHCGLIVSIATGTADVDAMAAWVAENAEARFTGSRPSRAMAP